MRSLPLMATFAVGVLLVASCGGDDDDASNDTTAATEAAAATTKAAPATTKAAPATTKAAPTTTKAAPTTTKAATTTTKAATATTAGASAGAPDPATEEADVETVFVTFFQGMAGGPDLLEDGEKYQEALTELASHDTAKDVTVTVASVTPVDDAACATAAVGAPCAAVKFDILFQGTPAIPDNTGYAVFQDGVWKVSGATFCSLAVLSLPEPAGCV